MGKDHLNGVCIFLKNSEGKFAAIKEFNHKPTMHYEEGKVKLLVEGLEPNESWGSGLIRLCEEELGMEHHIALNAETYFSKNVLVTSTLKNPYGAQIKEGNASEVPDKDDIKTMVFFPNREFFKHLSNIPHLKWYPIMEGYFVDYHDRLGHTIRTFEPNWPAYTLITGPSGSGKTTIMKQIGAFDLDDIGRRVDDEWEVPLTRILSLYHFNPKKNYIFVGVSRNTEEIMMMSSKTYLIKKDPITIAKQGITRDVLEDREGDLSERDYIMWARDFYDKMYKYHLEEWNDQLIKEKPVKKYLCSYFCHPHDRFDPRHVHKCTNLANQLGRCGFEATDANMCRLYKER